MKKAYIVHGWSGFPEEGWFPWARKELEKQGYQVQVPAMPTPDRPTIDVWVNTLLQLAPTPDEETVFIGHSIGCQTIMRYLEHLPANSKVKQTIFVAGWFTLSGIEDPAEQALAEPWLTRPINFSQVKAHVNNICAILSTDDSLVPYAENKKLFEQKLQATIITTQGGHLGAADNIVILPELLSALA